MATSRMKSYPTGQSQDHDAAGKMRACLCVLAVQHFQTMARGGGGPWWCNTNTGAGPLWTVTLRHNLWRECLTMNGCLVGTSAQVRCVQHFLGFVCLEQHKIKFSKNLDLLTWGSTSSEGSIVKFRGCGVYPAELQSRRLSIAWERIQENRVNPNYRSVVDTIAKATIFKSILWMAIFGK